ASTNFRGGKYPLKKLPSWSSCRPTSTSGLMTNFPKTSGETCRFLTVTWRPFASHGGRVAKTYRI
ncbi:hypothetical protein JZU69_04240, partial [bacterium]|nr:hypothetical protein [bacterium]